MQRCCNSDGLCNKDNVNSCLIWELVRLRLVLGWHGWRSNEFWICMINNGCVVSPPANVDATFKRSCPTDTSADCQNSYKPSAPCMQTLSELDFYRGGGGGGSPEGFICCCCTVVMHMHLSEASERLMIAALSGLIPFITGCSSCIWAAGCYQDKLQTKEVGCVK